jgi:hypothetical protein
VVSSADGRYWPTTRRFVAFACKFVAVAHDVLPPFEFDIATATSTRSSA